MLVTHYFEMDIALPCSTLALAVGWLPYREGPIATVPTQDGSTRQIPCRIVAAPSLIDKAADQLLHHIHTYVEAACELLGPYPFDRLDLLILPRCFACMGLKRYGKYKFETSIVFEQLHSMKQHNTIRNILLNQQNFPIHHIKQHCTMLHATKIHNTLH